MGRKYAITFSGVAVTAQQDFFYVAPADDKPIKILECRVGQSSDAGDAADEMLRVDVIRGHATVGSGGGPFTPLILAASGAAAGATCRINDTTVASAGTAQTMLADTFNVRAGWLYVPTPEAQIEVSQGANTTVVVRLLTTPADSLTMSGTLVIEEMG